MRLIDADAWLCETHFKEGIYPHEMLKKEIEVQPTIEAEPVKWIPVTERLPEPFVSVLVQMPGEKPFPTVREGFLSSNGIWHSALYDREPDEVTHWMPMPKPPEMDGGAENGGQ